MKDRQFFNFSSKEFDSRIRSDLRHLQREKDFCDVTISCEGRQIEAHKVILARGSLIFNNILKLNPQSHPLIFLSDVKFSYLLNILDFMYQGEVRIDKRELDEFLAVADDLKINDMTEEAFKDSKQSIEEKTIKPCLACSPKQQLNLDYKIKNENKIDNFHSMLNDLKVDALEDVEQFADEDFDNFEHEAKVVNNKEEAMDISSRQDFNAEEASKDSKLSIGEKIKNQQLVCRPKQELKRGYKIKNERKLNNFHSLKKDEQFSDEDFDNFEDEISGINIKEDLMQDFNIKIELEMENKNTVKKEKTIPTQEPVNINEPCSNELGLRIRDITKLSESKKQGQSSSCVSDISKSGFETYSSKSNLRTHVLTAHENINYPCSKCDYKCASKQYLKYHIQSTHEGIKYPCSHCDYKATNKRNLKTHIQSTHEEMKYPCSHCDYKATKKEYLTTHILSIHKGMKYPCSLCNYKATFKGSLKRHIMSTHEGMSYPCSHCDYKSTTKQSLKCHIQSTHEGIKYPCSDCDYKATKKGNLTAHIRSIHKGMKYSCSHCDYKANTKENLKIHIRSIHEGMRYPCSHCDYKATTKENLSRHIRSIHEEMK